MGWIPSTRLVKPLENTPNFLRKTTLLYKGFQSPPCHHSTAVVKLMYTFTNLCHEQNGLELGDEAVKIFLNTKGTTGEVDDDIDKFLAYVDGKSAEGEFTSDIAAEVERLKQKAPWKGTIPYSTVPIFHVLIRSISVVTHFPKCPDTPRFTRLLLRPAPYI